MVAVAQEVATDLPMSARVVAEEKTLELEGAVVAVEVAPVGVMGVEKEVESVGGAMVVVTETVAATAAVEASEAGQRG